MMLNNYVTVTELRNARTKWIKLNLEHPRESENYKVLANQLNLYGDEQYVIRSKKGRLQHSKLPGKTRNPILLDRDHKLSVLGTLRNKALRENYDSCFYQTFL